jgi:hypothetical protein
VIINPDQVPAVFLEMRPLARPEQWRWLRMRIDDSDCI